MKTLAVTLLSVLALPAFAIETPPLSDAQIAKVLITINEGEIAAAKMAEKTSKNEKVLGFAHEMRAQHEANMKDTKNIAKITKIGTEKSDLSKSLEADAKDANKDLKNKKKDGFDTAYVDEQVSMHKKALSTLNDTLIPAAQNAQLKAHLEGTSKAVAAHLEHAKTLQAE